MEQRLHQHIPEDYSNFELKNLSPDELHTRLLADLRPHLTFDEIASVNAAAELATYLHAEDTRSPGQYISHPLRIANRIVTYFEVHDPNLICAALLHDTVEDHAKEILALSGESTSSIEDAQRRSLRAIEELFSARTAEIVAGVTNPPYYGTDEGKHAFYVEHVKEAIQNPSVFLLKLSDFIDNAVGLHHTESAKLIRKLSVKYDPLYEVFLNRLEDDDMPLRDSVREYLCKQLLTGAQKNQRHMAA